jgi:hypothetical protein
VPARLLRQDAGGQVEGDGQVGRAGGDTALKTSRGKDRAGILILTRVQEKHIPNLADEDAHLAIGAGWDSQLAQANRYTNALALIAATGNVTERLAISPGLDGGGVKAVGRQSHIHIFNG